MDVRSIDYEVGMLSKHAQNDGEKHLNSNNGNNSIKCNNILMKALEHIKYRIQRSHDTSTVLNTKNGVFKANNRHSKLN